MTLKPLLIVLFCFFLSACASTGPSQGSPDIKITLEKNLNQDWTAYLEFPYAVSTASFVYSAGGYHSKSWIAASPNTDIKNIGGLDTIIFEEPTRYARFVFSPRKGGNARRLLPSQKFSDGSIAFSIGEFAVVPLNNVTAVRDLGGNIRKWRGRNPSYQLTVKSPDPIFTQGERYQGTYSVSFDHNDTQLIHVGSQDYIKTPYFDAILDKQLPPWLSQRFQGDITDIYKAMSESWGQVPTNKTEITFLMDGFDSDFVASSGVAIDGKVLLLKVSGKGYLRKSERKLKEFLTLLAHEVVHIFQDRGGEESVGNRAPWMSEGAANVMARDIMFRKSILSDADIQTDYQDSYASCVETLQGGFSFGRTNSQSRYYDCGDIISLMTDKALPNNSLYDFWNRLLNNSKGRRITSKLYFKTMSDMGVNQAVVSAMKRLVDDKIENADPLNSNGNQGEALKPLMVAVGLNPVFDANGTLKRLDWQ